MRTDVLIIGGGAAGVMAAVTAKRLYGDKSVTLVRTDPEAVVPCGIPYIFGTLDSARKNIMPDKPMENLGVARVIDEAVELDVEKKVVHLKGSEAIEYDKLMIATGSSPARLPIEGFDLEGVWVVRKSLAYLEKMREAVMAAKKIVIIGGGFIGVEFADDISLIEGKEVHVVEMLPHCLALAFDDEFCEAGEAKMKEAGIHIHTNARVKRIVGENRVSGVEVEGVGTIDADMVIVSVGARSNNELAKNAGIEVNRWGGIVVDRYMRTSAADVFAAGDCAEKRCFFSGKVIPALLASVACAEARIGAGAFYSLCTVNENRGSLTTFTTKVRNLALGGSGLTERRAKQEGFRTVVGVAQNVDKHPGTLPGTSPLKVKLIFSEKGVLLGGQVFGGGSVGELCNAISVAIQNGMTLDRLFSMQIGTHPFFTASPIAYPFVSAAIDAAKKL